MKVTNQGPTVWIIKPTPGQTLYTGSPFVLEGDSSDPNEPSLELPCSSLKWTSNNASDPFPKWGCTPTVTFTTPGTRLITLRGTDSEGDFDSVTVTINVVNPPANSAPIVTILNPHNNDSLNPDAYVTLQGTANDPDNASSLAYEWRLKNGATWTTLFTGTMNDGATILKSWKPANNVPFHCGGKMVRLYLYVTDPSGQTGSAYVDVYIAYPPC